MVYLRIVEGSPSEIAKQISQMVGEKRVTVLLMEDAAESGSVKDLPPRLSEEEFEKVMADIRADAVRSSHFVDDSREAIYTRQDGE